MILLSNLSVEEWLNISDIILNINSVNDVEFRMSFLKNLESVIPFDVCTFFLGHNLEDQKKVIDPIVYKHNYDKVSDPTILFKEYEKIFNTDYCSWIAWNSESTVIRESDILSDSLRQSTELYKRIDLPVGTYYCCRIYIICNNLFLGLISLSREKQSGDFTDKDMFILEYIKPHLTYRMYQLHPQSKTQISNKGMFLKRFNLTEKEFEVMLLICKGFTNKEMATKLFITENTIKKHILHIFKKMNVNCRSKLINKCADNPYSLSTPE